MIEKIIKAIENRGVLTGSRALWGATDESDWDYILESEDFDKIYAKLKQLGIELKEIVNYRFSIIGIYFIHDAKVYNLINCTPEQFIAWNTVLEMMKLIPVEYRVFLNKKKRKELYQRYVAIFELEIQGVTE